MLHLLYIEWMKLKNYRTFWILGALFILSLFGVNYIGYEIQQQVFSKQNNNMATAFLGNPPFRFPDVWQTVSYISSFLLFFPGLIIIILMTNEFSYKTHRQNIIDGVSRRQFVTAKIILAVLIAFVSTVVVFLVAVFFGFREGSASVSFTNLQYISYYFIQALSYTLVALMFAVLFRRSGISIGVYFLYSVVLEEAFVKGVHYYFGDVSHFFPLESTDNLITFPVFKNMVEQVAKPPDVLPLLIAAAVYVAVYIFICEWRFRKADL